MLVKRSNRYLWEMGRLLLFVINLDKEANNADDEDTKLNHIRICNHLPQPPFYKSGGNKKR